RAAGPERLTRLVETIAAAHGLVAEVEYLSGYPVTVNEAGEVARAARVCRELLGGEGWLDLEHPVAGAEDFSYVLEEVPGAFVFVGATPPGLDLATAPYNHSAQARFDDGAVPVTAA